MKHVTNNKPLPRAVLLAHLFFATIFMLQAQDFLLPVGSTPEGPTPIGPPPVGAIPGEIDISLMGAATYTIPIEVAPGTQGIQPNLSIVYNSFGGMGLLGMKWNLAGLSAITRCGENLYFDNDITTINFGTYSHTFALDGERLIMLQNIFSNGIQREFATEIENFSRVYSHGSTTPRAVPTHFTVYNDDGAIIEYGNSEDSKHRLQDENNIVTLGWYINKITDANGNYMTFHYGKSNAEIWIDEIKYTGNVNSGMQTYAKVKFAYSTIPDKLGRNTYYVGGYATPQTKLLETITVFYGNDVVRKYLFKYTEDNTGELTTHLKEVLLYGEGGKQHLNETKIKWGEQNNNVESNTLSNFSGGEQIVTGDFNGDGYCDYVVYNIGSGRERTWQLWLQNPADNTYYINCTGKSLKSFAYSCNINEDRNDELILAEDRETLDAAFEINVFEYKNNSFYKRKLNDVTYFFQAHFGDFNGDGKIDIMYEHRYASNNNVTLSFSNGNGLVSSNLSFSNIVDLQIIDYNGDGKTDIQITKENGTEIYSYSNTSHDFNLLFSSGFPTKWHNLFHGDFNGDGISDIITFHDGTWALNFGLGNGNYTYPADTLKSLDGEKSGSKPKYPVFIADVNGDGKDDIIQAIYFDANKQTSVNIHCSKGCINMKYLYNYFFKILSGDCSDFGNIALGSLWHLGDFNGDGKTDLLIRKSYTDTKPVIIYINKDKQYEYVKEITDGLGKKMMVEYTPTYLPFTSASLGKQRKSFAELATSVKISNGIGNAVNELRFSYKTPIYSFKRKTFLGFQQFVTKKVEDNIITTDTLHSRTYHDLYPVPSLSFDREMLLPRYKIHATNLAPYTINENRYGYEFVDLQNLRFVINTNIQWSYDYLSDIKTKTTTVLNDDKRVGSTETLTYYKCNSDTWFHSETNTYLYETITLSGKQKKTVLKKVTTNQKYHKNSNIVLTNTLSYNYYTDATNKGRLEWEQNNNSAGSITTSYNNYLIPGICKEKTVSAAGVSRKATYDYDETKRFATSIKNVLNHEKKITYDTKTGNKIKEIDPNGLTTKYDYDAFGNLTEVTYPDGTTTNSMVEWYSSSNIPNAKYRITTKTDAKPDVTVYYDLLGREVCRYEDGQYYETQYDNKGQVERTSYPFSAFNEPRIWHEYTYDPYGRKLTETAPYTNLSYSYSINEFYRIVTVNDNGVESSKSYDVLGRIVRATDQGGTIYYSYNIINESNKKYYQTIITVSGGGTTTILTDQWGNRLSITDPDAGEITSTYTKLNELETQTDDKGNVTSYQYDVLGRVIQKKFSEPSPRLKTQIIDYIYDTANKGIGKLRKIIVDGVETEIFYYDNLSHLQIHQKKIDNTFYAQTYTYDNNGQLQTLTYPDGFKINYSYLSDGKLKEIRRNDDNRLIYKVTLRNKYNQTTGCEYGNEVVTKYEYNPYGLLTRIQTGKQHTSFSTEVRVNERGGIEEQLVSWLDSTILNYRYAYDNKGLLVLRSESVVNRLEKYQYDQLERLLSVTAGKIGETGAVQTITYANNGNITNNSKVGIYHYETTTPPKPHAVSLVVPINENVISANQCVVSYNFFNQPTQISEGPFKLALFYDANQQRNKVIKYNNNTVELTHFYVTKRYEKEVSSAGTRHYHYIYGDNGVVALHIAYPNTDSMYYVHTDHLGSYCAITNAGKQVRQRNCFDPWGNITQIFPLSYHREDTIVVGEAPTLNFFLTNRGFTGHEHYPYFKIINMNGRLYDPVIGRFFSPDKYVANSSFTQDFNRYTYARNNPLMYTDPEGEFLTWSIGNNGFSIGINFTPWGIPLGCGINVGWWNGGSIGFYGEVAYRVGGTGLGAGAGISQSIDYGFGSKSWTTTTGVSAYGSLGLLNAGVNGSYGYDITNKKGTWGWGVNAGVNIFGNDSWGIGLNVGYGSSGFTYGVGGYYNPMAWKDNPNYEPDKWNDGGNIIYDESGKIVGFDPTIQLTNNCYTYALDDINNGKFWGMNPGDYSNEPFNVLSLNDVTNAAISDGRIKQPNFWNKLGFGKKGYYSVYLVSNDGVDYHWYRQDKGGYWSHKPGVTSVQNTNKYYPTNINHGNYNNGGILLWARRR